MIYFRYRLVIIFSFTKLTKLSLTQLIYMKNHLLLLFILIYSFSSSAQKGYQSLCWKISGNGLEKTSYLYGTFHSQDQRVFDFKEGVIEAFNEADIYAMELNIDSIDRGKMMTAMIMDSNKTLKNLLSVEDYEMVNTFFIDSIGMSLFMFNKMQPFMTTQMIVTKGLNKENALALDMHWFKEAKKQEKQLVGLETMIEQINVFKSISVEQQAEELVKSVKEYGNNDVTDINKMVEIYQSGDLDQLMEVMNEYAEDSPIESTQFNETFLYARNINMANRVIQYLEKGSVFMAVGAAHLPGEKGVIELLRAKGYLVEVLN